jgi:energy-coupling factor transport system substrate-specific component
MTTTPAQEGQLRTEFRKIPRTYLLALVPAAVALNIVAGYITAFLRLPIYLSETGTAVVALGLGPWAGALTAILTNLVQVLLSSPLSLIFMAVSVPCALVEGFGARLGMAKTLPRFFLLSILVSLTAALAATPIYLYVFGGATGHGSDVLTAAFIAMGQPLVLAVIGSRLLTELSDKVLSMFIALPILQALPPMFRAQLEAIKAPALRKVVWMVGALILVVATILVRLALAK